MKHSFFALFAVSAMCACAQTMNLDLRPGLWETTTVMSSTGRPPIDTSKMSPEARKRLEESMKRREGPQTRTNRSCMSKDDMHKTFFDAGSACKRTFITNTRTVVDAKVECPNAKFPSSGTVHVEALSRESAQGSVKMTGAMNIDMTVKAKWISDNCGSEK